MIAHEIKVMMTGFICGPSIRKMVNISTPKFKNKDIKERIPLYPPITIIKTSRISDRMTNAFIFFSSFG
jgi:hypothetical protein